MRSFSTISTRLMREPAALSAGSVDVQVSHKTHLPKYTRVGNKECGMTTDRSWSDLNRHASRRRQPEHFSRICFVKSVVVRELGTHLRLQCSFDWCTTVRRLSRPDRGQITCIETRNIDHVPITCTHYLKMRGIKAVSQK